MQEEEDDDNYLYTAEELAAESQPLFLNTRAGKCLTDVLNHMYLEGSLGFEHLQEVPLRFEDCMRRVVAAKVSKDTTLRVRAQLEQYRDIPSSANWHCLEGTISLTGAEELIGKDFDIRATY